MTTSFNSVSAWSSGLAPQDLSLVEMPHKIVIFGLAETIATSAHFLTLILLVEAGDIAPVLATSAGSMMGALVNYLLNYRYTFRSTKAHLDAGPKFFSIALMTGLLNAVLVYLGVDLLDRHYLPVQVCATLTVFLANFVLNSAWTFREENPT